MNSEIKLGVINHLKIDRDTDHGLYLVADDGEEDVLLPGVFVKQDMQIGDIIDVFIYTDSEDRLVATTQTPKAMLGEFGLFKVVDATDIGVFVDWGLSKDLFVPKSVQKKTFEVGRKYILRVAYDVKTDRLFGDSRVGRYLENDAKLMEHIKMADIFIIACTPLGYKVIADDKYEGMIYHNEIFEDIKIGDKKKGYIKQVREDGKFDISLQPIGKDKEDVNCQRVVSKLQKDASLPFSYKSDAEDIKATFGLSKKNFKKALTKLKDEQLIVIDESGIKLK